MSSNFGHTSLPSFFLFVERLSSPFQRRFQYHCTHQSPWCLLPSYQPLGLKLWEKRKRERERESLDEFHPMGGGCSLETKSMLNFTVDIPIPDGWWVTVTITKIQNRCTEPKIRGAHDKDGDSHRWSSKPMMMMLTFSHWKNASTPNLA